MVDGTNAEQTRSQFQWVNFTGCTQKAAIVTGGGKPLSPIRLKPFKLLITYIYPTIFYQKWSKT